MYQIDMSQPDLGLGDDGGGPGDGLALDGLGATSWEVGQLIEVLAGMPDDELDALERDGADWMNEAERNGWMDALSDAEYLRYSAEVSENAADPGEYLDMVRGVETALESRHQLDAARLAQDQAEQARRSGPPHRRPSDEVMLATGMARVAASSYLPGQQLDMAGDLWALGQFDGSTASPVEIRERMLYELEGSPAPSRRYAQPLPPVASLAKRIGLRP